MKNKSVLLLGVGGVSMHQLALAYIGLGYSVLGYDAKFSNFVKIAVDAGMQFTNKFDKDFLNVDFCVKTAAIKDSNRYIKAVKKLGVPVLDRAFALEQLIKNFKCVIAVAGTHGKSTTCALIYEILRQAGKKVSCHIGAEVFEPNFNLTDEFLVLEACEYNKSFLNFYPSISVVTNVEPEHLDCYKTMFNLRAAFKTFLNRAKTRFVFDEASTKFLKKSNNLNFVKQTDLKLNTLLKGEYNLKNISLAIEVCKFLGIEQNVIIKAINSFAGLPRRNEFLALWNGKKVFIDYAHHPTELQAFSRQFLIENKNGIIIFQPHTYSRTKLLLNQFLAVFKNIPNLIIYKEYSAREKRSEGLTAHDLFVQIKQINPNVKYCATPKCLAKNLNVQTNLAFVGAGDINLVAKKLIEKF